MSFIGLIKIYSYKFSFCLLPVSPTGCQESSGHNFLPVTLSLDLALEWWRWEVSCLLNTGSPLPRVMFVCDTVSIRSTLMEQLVSEQFLNTITLELLYSLYISSVIFRSWEALTIKDICCGKSFKALWDHSAAGLLQYFVLFKSKWKFCFLHQSLQWGFKK